jgi:hypothetical protein
VLRAIYIALRIHQIEVDGAVCIAAKTSLAAAATTTTARIMFSRLLT